MTNDTDKVPISLRCVEHSAQIARVERAEKDIQLLWKENNQMKTWFIAGMGGLLVQGIGIVVNMFVGK